MEALEQSECVPYRAIVFRRGAAELLLAPEGARFHLPAVGFYGGQRLAETISSALRDEWNCNTACLFELDVASRSYCVKPIRYQVMECCDQGTGTRIQGRWLAVGALSLGCFADSADYEAAQQALVQYESYANGLAPGPFAKPGWLEELRDLVREASARTGLQLQESFCHFNASPTFSLVRFETTGAAIWFKAVGEPNAREFPITVLLAALFPTYIPSIIATKPDWNGWLSPEVAGTALDETRDTTAWKAAAAALAQLQIESVGKEDELLSCGVRDLRVCALSELVHPFLKAVGELMEQQVKVPPPVLCHEEMLLLEEHIHEALAYLENLGIPNTLGHLDLNPGNIIVSPHACVFLDWAEAYAGPPFLSFQYLLEHLRRAAGHDAATEAQLAAVYADQWRTVTSRRQIEEALSVAPLLAVFAYAAGSNVWSDETKLRNPQTAGFLRSLTRRMKRETARLVDRRSPCLS